MPIDINALPDADRALVDQVLCEGEVAAQVQDPDGLQAREAVFASVERVLHLRGGQVVRDAIKIGLRSGAGQCAVAVRARHALQCFAGPLDLSTMRRSLRPVHGDRHGTSPRLP